MVLGESLSGPTAPYARHIDVSKFSVLRCSGVSFCIICCFHETAGNLTHLSAPSREQSPPDAMHIGVIAHSGASSFGAAGSRGLLGTLLGRPGEKHGVAHAMHNDV